MSYPSLAMTPITMQNQIGHIHSLNPNRPG